MDIVRHAKPRLARRFRSFSSFPVFFVFLCGIPAAGGTLARGPWI